MWKSRKQEANQQLLALAANRFPGPWMGMGSLENVFNDNWRGYPPMKMGRWDDRFGYDKGSWASVYTEGHIHELVRYGGADVNTRDAMGNTPLMLAISSQNSGVAVSLIRKFAADVNAANKYGDTPLMQAVSTGQSSLVRELLLGGANIATKDQKQMTAADIAATVPAMAAMVPFLKGEKPLSDLRALEKQEALDRAVADAAYQGYSDKLKDALDQGGSANAATEQGTPALFFTRGPEITQLLIDRGADVNARDANGRTALMTHCERGHDQTVAVLLKAGADLTATDNDNKTAADYAARDTRCLDQLDAETIRRAGNDPVQLAALEKKKATRDLFSAIRADDPMNIAAAIKAGADPYAAGPNGMNAMTLSLKDGTPAATAVLIASGVDINKPDSNGLTPAAAAFTYNQTRRFTKLLQMGADPNARLKDGETLLNASLRMGGDAYKALVDAKADPNVPGKDGRTAIHFIAAQGGMGEMVRKLADIGANLNAVDKDGNTALMIALKDGKPNTAEELVKAGADVTIANAAGETAASLAKNLDLKLSHLIHEKLVASKDTRIAALEDQVRSLSTEITKPQAPDASTPVPANSPKPKTP